MSIDLPILHPESYAFSLTAGYVLRGGDIELTDRIDNALIFEVLSTEKVHLMMNFANNFERE